MAHAKGRGCFGPFGPESQQDANQNNARSRRGFILLVVTVIIILLSLAAYGYLNSMATEHAAAAMFGRDVEARMAAESAVEFAACQIALKETDPSIDVYHNPGTFRNQAMNETDNRVVSFASRSWCPTLTGHSGNAALGFEFRECEVQHQSLMEFENDTDDTTDPYTAVSYIPNMTEDITNAILDWIDSDEEARLGGAESVTYQGLAVPYSARNAPLESSTNCCRFRVLHRNCFMVKMRIATVSLIRTKTMGPRVSC